MSHFPKVSLVIPFYNCVYIGQAIDSALQQSYPHTEVIVVNDGSTEHADQLKPFIERIVYLEKSNGGTGSALNMGIRHASGQYFTWLSSDDLYDRDKVGKQVQFMLDQNATVSYTSYRQMDAAGKVISPPAGIHYSDPLEFKKRMHRGCFINGCTVMLRMDVFRKVGLFNEALKYTQDYEMWLRILQLYEFKYTDEPLVLYRVHKEMGTLNYQPDIMKELFHIRKKYCR